MGLGTGRWGTHCLGRAGFVSESEIKPDFTTTPHLFSLPFDSTEEHSLVKYSISVNGIPDDVLCRSVGASQCSGYRGSKCIEYLCAHHGSAI